MYAATIANGQYAKLGRKQKQTGGNIHPWATFKESRLAIKLSFARCMKKKERKMILASGMAPTKDKKDPGESKASWDMSLCLFPGLPNNKLVFIRDKAQSQLGWEPPAQGRGYLCPRGPYMKKER